MTLKFVSLALPSPRASDLYMQFLKEHLHLRGISNLDLAIKSILDVCPRHYLVSPKDFSILANGIISYPFAQAQTLE